METWKLSHFVWSVSLYVFMNRFLPEISEKWFDEKNRDRKNNSDTTRRRCYGKKWLFVCRKQTISLIRCYELHLCIIFVFLCSCTSFGWRQVFVSLTPSLPIFLPLSDHLQFFITSVAKCCHSSELVSPICAIYKKCFFFPSSILSDLGVIYTLESMWNDVWYRDKNQITSIHRCFISFGIYQPILFLIWRKHWLASYLTAHLSWSS